MPRARSVPYYPAFLDLCDKQVVVVGGGTIATATRIPPARPG